MYAGIVKHLEEALQILTGRLQATHLLRTALTNRIGADVARTGDR